MKWFVYTLSDPTTRAVRYVGWTVDPVTRLKRHVHQCRSERTHKAHWIRTLRDAGLSPVMTIIETGEGATWKTAERRWITHHRTHGASLVNLTDGGDGRPGHRPSAETRARMSAAHRGRTHSDEAKAKCRAANLGKKHSPERSDAMSRIRKGKAPVAATEAAAKRNKGRPQSPEHIEKRIAPLRGRARPGVNTGQLDMLARLGGAS